MIDQTDDIFAGMGKPIDPSHRAIALRHLREMVPEITTSTATLLIDTTARAIERDQPYAALAAARTMLDLTGAYRLMAALLAPLEGSS